MHPIVTPVCVIPSHLISVHFISCPVFSRFFTSSHLTSPHLISSHVSLFLAALLNCSHLFSCHPSFSQPLVSIGSSPFFSCQVVSTHPISAHLNPSRIFSALLTSSPLFSIHSQIVSVFSGPKSAPKPDLGTSRHQVEKSTSLKPLYLCKNKLKRKMKGSKKREISENSLPQPCCFNLKFPSKTES